MEKVDFKKQLKALYGGKVGQQCVVEVPKMNFLMIDGHGDPNTSQEYIDAIQTLYPLAYTLKFMCKKELSKDYGVMPLEGIWWAKDMSAFTRGDKASWSWTAMIMQPEFVTKELYARALEEVKTKKNPPAIDKVRLEAYDEGRAAQVMYAGPYADEGPTIQKLHEFIHGHGGTLEKATKHHHEIYLGDPRKADPSKLKTIIRQPF